MLNSSWVPAACSICADRAQRNNSYSLEPSNTELRSNIVVETDTGTRGRGDAEQMNVLRMNATAYNLKIKQKMEGSKAEMKIHIPWSLLPSAL